MSKTSMMSKLSPSSARGCRSERPCKTRIRPSSSIATSNHNNNRARIGDVKIVDLEDGVIQTVSASNDVGDRLSVPERRVRCHTAPPRAPGLLSSTGTVVLESRTHSSNPAMGSPGRKTITRTSRKSRPVSTLSADRDDARSVGRATDVSDADDARSGGTRTATRSTHVTELLDFGGTDIYNDSGWDTDLEGEDEDTTFDRSLKAIYMDSCKNARVIPASYFVRHMQDNCLEMKHHGLGPEGIKPVSVALVSNTNVLSLNLTDNWLGRVGGFHVCDMLKENCYITEIDLSDNRLDYSFAERFIDVLSNNSTLTHATLSGNNFDDRAAVYFAEAIMTTTCLEYLSLSRNQLAESAGVILGPAIAENTSLRELDLSWNSIRRRGAVALAQGIKNNVLLQAVNLSWNGFGNEGAKAVGDALKVNSTLQCLDLSNSRITTEGAVLLGKGLALSESLQILKMGKNPMQSSGCYGICAAILRNPNSVMDQLDFSDIMVNSDFQDVYNKLKEKLPDLRLRHGGDGVPKRPKARVHPMVKLQNYIAKHNLKLLDFFNKFDSDGSMSVSREEFTEGIHETGIKLTDEEIGSLLDELDADGDGEINYSEMVMGHQDFTEKEKKMATTIMQYKR